MSVREAAGPADHICLEADFPGSTPEQLFACFTEPAQLALWWPPDAQVEPRQGGAYAFSWPKMGWRLSGRFVHFSPPTDLAFTWQWDHEPLREPPLIVKLRFEATEAGARLHLQHGPFGKADADRPGIIEGWNHFLPRLPDACAG